MNKYIKIISIFSISLILLLSACVKNDFTKPAKAVYNPNIKATTTIQELKNLNTNELTLIDTNVIIKGTVIANDKSGNLYKSIFIQDSTAGIQISLDAYNLCNKYHTGDLIYVKCNGLYIGKYGGQIQLGADYEGSVGRIAEPLIDSYLIKSDGGIPIVPKTINLSAVNGSFVNELVQLKNVQFKRYSVGDTYGDIVLKEDKDSYVEDCDGNSMIIRTSGYADFASDIIPEGNGNMTAVLTKYNSTYQLIIRNIREVNMTSERCGAFFNEDFEEFTKNDLIDKFGWFSYSVTGSQYWEIGNYDGNNNYASMTGYDGSSYVNEDWLITPKFDFTGFSDIQFSFENASNYSGPNIQVFVSTDYDGTDNPNNFTWTELTGLNLSSGSFSWVTATKDLSSYANSPSVYIGFKYSSDTSSKTWEIDNVKIIAN
ncbi:MAG: hypothetical protein GXO80_06370 [Chlorobi bacterium]|nr:hypothetical protein [Chlorobiota bacterium]